jgi:hypothetical protein
VARSHLRNRDRLDSRGILGSGNQGFSHVCKLNTGACMSLFQPYLGITLSICCKISKVPGYPSTLQRGMGRKPGCGSHTEEDVPLPMGH